MGKIKKKKSSGETFSKKEKEILLVIKNNKLNRRLAENSINQLQDDLLEVVLKLENKLNNQITTSNNLLNKILAATEFNFDFLELVAKYAFTLNNIQLAESDDILMESTMNNKFKSIMEINFEVLVEFINKELAEGNIERKSLIDEANKLVNSHFKKISNKIKEECLDLSLETSKQLYSSNIGTVKDVVENQIQIINDKLSTMSYNKANTIIKILLTQSNETSIQKVLDYDFVYYPIIIKVQAIAGENGIESELYDYIKSLGISKEKIINLKPKNIFNKDKDYNYKELNSLAEQQGYILDRCNGDHGIFIKKTESGEKLTIIPQGRAIGRGLQLTILKSLE